MPFVPSSVLAPSSDALCSFDPSGRLRLRDAKLAYAKLKNLVLGSP